MSEAKPEPEKGQIRPPAADMISRTCSTCFKDLSHEVFCCCIRCKGFIQCLECCAHGYCKDDHIRTHPFIVCRQDYHAIFVEDWSAIEEILLLIAIEIAGLGNWSSISQIVKTKSPDECSTHYYGVYCNDDCAPMPTPEIRPPLPLPEPLPFETDPTESCPSLSPEENLTSMSKKMPVEINGYMPRRGEFEEEFNDEAEHLVDGMVFDETEPFAKFEAKLNLLSDYNSQVIARREKTRIVEEWNLQFSKEKEWQNVLTGITGTRDVDKKILTLAPFEGRTWTEKLGQRLRELSHNIEMIEWMQHWQEKGVRTRHEGYLLNSLEQIMKDGRVPEKGADEWNKKIEAYMDEYGKTETEEAKLLTESELALCHTEDIDPPAFCAIKDLILREYSISGCLTLDNVTTLLPERSRQIAAMYELFVSNGWISE